MLRRRKTRNSASSHPGLGLPKGRTIASVKREKRATQSAVIRRTRARVFARDLACRICLGKRRNVLDDEMHELVARSHTRGMPPEQRFNTQNCVRLCHVCHVDVTERRLRITGDGDGLVDVVIVGGEELT